MSGCVISVELFHTFFCVCSFLCQRALSHTILLFLMRLINVKIRGGKRFISPINTVLAKFNARNMHFSSCTYKAWFRYSLIHIYKMIN